MSAALPIELSGPVEVAANPPAGRDGGFQDVLGQQLSGFDVPQRAPGRGARALPDEAAPDAILPDAEPVVPAPLPTLPLASLPLRRGDGAVPEPAAQPSPIAAAVVAATPAPGHAAAQTAPTAAELQPIPIPTAQQAVPIPAAQLADPAAAAPSSKRIAIDAERPDAAQGSASSSEPARASLAAPPESAGPPPVSAGAPPVAAGPPPPGAGAPEADTPQAVPASPRPEAQASAPVAAETIAPPDRAVAANGATVAPSPTPDRTDPDAALPGPPGANREPAPPADLPGTAAHAPSNFPRKHEAGHPRHAAPADRRATPVAEAAVPAPEPSVGRPEEVEPRHAGLAPAADTPGRAASPSAARPDVLGPAATAGAAGAESESEPEADGGERRAPHESLLTDVKPAAAAKAPAEFRPPNAAPVAETAAIERVESRSGEPIPAPRGSATSEGIAHQVQWLAREGGGSARVRLNPPSLGEIELHVRLRGGVVDVRVMALDPAAQQALAGERASLAHGLALRDLRMEGFTVTGPGDADGELDADAGAERREERPTRDPGAPGQAWRTGAVAGSAPAEAVRFAAPAAPRDNALDLRA